MKKGQVWVETVIYTLIALVLIGAVLAIARPRIQEMQDVAVVEKSLTLLKNLDNTISLIGIPGNQRIIEVTLKQGELIIDGDKDMIIFRMDSSAEYSEIGRNVTDGNFVIRTEKVGSDNRIFIERYYTLSAINLTYKGGDIVKTLSKSSTSYKLNLIKREDFGERSVIDVELN